MHHDDIRRRGFRDRIQLAQARQRLRERTDPHGRTETVPIESADHRIVGASIAADRDVPHYARAAMDGFAVRAEDTVGASRQAPVTIRVREGEEMGARARRVHTGSELPAGADAVVKIEDVERREDRLDVFTAVAEGANVGPPGEDVEAGTTLFRAGDRLRPSDLGLLKSVGRSDVPVRQRPRVAVHPTGDELVQEDPEPGEIIETNALTVTRLVERWGGEARYHTVVPDERSRLREAVEPDDGEDLVVTTGGSSVGERDLVPEVVAERGEVFVHGVALKPGHPVALGAIDDTPIVMLPGYPVACLVNAMQFLRRAIAWTMEADPYPIPGVLTTLEGKIRSEAGHRTFARVSLDESGEEPIARPVRTSGAGILSSVAAADGWVVTPEAREGIPAGETVTVERWEWPP